MTEMLNFTGFEDQEELPTIQVDDSLGDTSLKPPLPSSFAADRTAKFNFVLAGEENAPTVDFIRQQVDNQDETKLQETIAFHEKSRLTRSRNDLIKGMLTANAGRPISDNLTQAIDTLSADISVSAENAMERRLAELVTQHAVTGHPNSPTTEALAEDFEGTQQDLDFTSESMMKTEIAKRELGKISAEIGSTSYLGLTGDFVQTLIPLYDRVFAGTQDVVTDQAGVKFDTPFLPGGNREEQIRFLYAQPPEQFGKLLNAAMESIKENNVFSAQQFAADVVSYAGSKAYLDSALFLTEVGELLPIGIAGRVVKAGKVASAASRQKNMLREMIRSEARPDTTPRDIADATGDVNTAAVAGASESLARRANTAQRTGQDIRVINAADTVTDTRDRLKRLTDDTISYANPSHLMEGGRRFSREVQARIEAAMLRGVEFPELLTNLNNPNRTTKEGFVAAAEEAAEQLSDLYRFSNDKVVAQNIVFPDQTAGRVGVLVTDLGKADGSAFDTANKADLERKRMGFSDQDSDIVQHGADSYYIRTYKDIDTEDTEAVHKAHLLDPETKMSKSILNHFFGLRTPNDYLSLATKQARISATHLHSNVMDLAREQLGVFKEMSKSELADLKRVLNYDHLWLGEETGEIGRFARNISQLDDHYLEVLGRLPTENEVVGYFNMVKLNDMDYIMNNLGVYTDLVQLGVQEVSVGAQDLWFKGKVVDNIPWNSPDDDLIYLEGGDVFRKKEILGDANHILRTKIRDEGYRVVKVHNPVEEIVDQDGNLVKQMELVSGKNLAVDYVVTKKLKRRDLSFQQVPYNTGGHRQYNDGFFMKQPKIETDSFGRKVYAGERTLFHAASEAEIKQFSDAMERARKAFVDNDPATFNRIVDNELPWTDAADLKREIRRGRIDKDQPIGWVRDGGRLLDGDVSPHITRESLGIENDVFGKVREQFSEVRRDFTGERDPALPKVSFPGAAGKPVFVDGTSSAIDAMTSISRGYSRIAKQRTFSDAKTLMVRNFISEFGDVLTEPLKGNSLQAFAQAKFKSRGADPAKVNAALAAHRATMNFLGRPTLLGDAVQSINQKATDAIFKRFGTKGSDLVTGWELYKLDDPTRWARSIAFHTKLGFFNPVQLLLQAQTMANISAFAPEEVTRTMSAAFMFRTLNLTSDPDRVRWMAQKATRFGWKEDEFVEAYNSMRETGLFNIGSEQAILDDLGDEQLFKGRTASFLDKGAFFFKEGERLPRLAAYALAYRRWRQANPKAPLDSFEINRILDRADDYSMNMTRASNASWQRGVWNMPGQFVSYQLRMLEVYFSGRLTWQEKARLFATHSALYGVPLAGAGPVGLFYGALSPAIFDDTSGDIYDDIRLYLEANGMDPDGPALKFFVDGIPSAAYAMISGDDLAFNERFAPNNTQFIHEAVTGEKSLLSVFGGASADITLDIIGTLYPPLRGLAELTNDDPRQGKPFVVNDFVEILGNISTFSQIERAMMIYNTEEYTTRSGKSIPVESHNSIYQLMGVTHRDVLNAWRHTGANRRYRTLQSKIRRKATREIEKSYQAESAKDRQVYLDRAARYFILGGFDPAQKNRIVKQALKNIGRNFAEEQKEQFLENTRSQRNN